MKPLLIIAALLLSACGSLGDICAPGITSTADCLEEAGR